jgi:peptidoglycan/xylan/chitin deacetylase (PgdA/CDA1 family)
MYHRIVPLAQAGDSNRSLVVPPTRFAAQLSELAAAGWRTITLSGLADDLEAGVRPPPRTFVITIDDGWADGYTYALPILRQHGFVATYFVIAGRIDWPDFLSADELRALVAAGDEIGDHTMDHVSLGGGSASRLTYEVDAAAATIASVTGFWPATLAYPGGHYSSAAEAIIEACGMKMAVIEGDGTWESWATRFAIPRVKVYPGTSPATLLEWVEHPWKPAPA